eukprot:5645014-Amphidinium_carterae.1
MEGPLLSRQRESREEELLSALVPMSSFSCKPAGRFVIVDNVALGENMSNRLRKQPYWWTYISDTRAQLDVVANCPRQSIHSHRVQPHVVLGGKRRLNDARMTLANWFLYHVTSLLLCKGAKKGSQLDLQLRRQVALVDIRDWARIPDSKALNRA